MKKLMIIAAVALASTLTQAASFTWGTETKAWGVPSSALAAGLEGGKSYNVGSANADTMSNQISANSASWAYVLTLSYNDGSSTVTDTLSGNLTSGSFASRKVNLDLSSDLVVAGRDLTYTLVFTGTITDGNSASFDVTSNEIAGNWHVNDLGAIGLQTAAASSFTTAGVPEPTSGILMLVGLGALALRRRKA